MFVKAFYRSHMYLYITTYFCKSFGDLRKLLSRQIYWTHDSSSRSGRRRKWSEQSVSNPTLWEVKKYLLLLSEESFLTSPCSCYACLEKTGWFLHNTLRKNPLRSCRPCAGLSVLSRAPHTPSWAQGVQYPLTMWTPRQASSKEGVNKLSLQ